MMDSIDFRILRFTFRDEYMPYYVQEIAKQMNISISFARLRLKKLTRMNYFKEMKAYPVYYIPNIEKKFDVDRILIPSNLLEEIKV